jgi:hypothetical protein
VSELHNLFMKIDLKKKEQKRAGTIFRDFLKKYFFFMFHFFHEKNVFLQKLKRLFFIMYVLEQEPST